VYYRLLAVNGMRLPAPSRWGDRQHVVARGGLLLEPPTNLPLGMLNEGYALLRLFNERAPGPLASIGSTASAYRWLGPGELEIANRHSSGSLTFHGYVTVSDLELTSGAGDRFIPIGTTFQFLEAPEEPISEDWRSALDFGPGLLVSTPGSKPPSRHEVEAFQAFIEQQEPARTREAYERLERAWRASA